MKKLFIEILAVLLFVAGVVCFLEYKYAGYKNSFDLRFDYLEKRKDVVSEVYMGNSHIGAFKEVSLNNASPFNLSFGGQDLFHMMIVLEKYLPEMPNLKKIILGVDFELLGYNYILSNQRWKDRQYYPYTGRLYDNSLANRIMAASNFFRANRKLNYLFMNHDTKTKPNTIEFIPKNSKKLTDKDCELRAIEHSKLRYDEDLVDENLGYLKSIIALCKKHSIELIMLSTPKLECYREHYDTAMANRNSIKITDLAKENNMKFINLHNDNGFDEADFVDFDHLNENGVIKVLQIINQKKR